MARKGPSLPTNISKLAFGTGKVSKSNETERVDLHFKHSEYNRFIVERTRPKLLFAFPQQSEEKAGGVKKNSSRWEKAAKENEMSLSKTYLTKSGTMLLYSDRKVMKDKDSESEASENDNLDITGQSIARSKSSVSNSKWVHHVGKKTDRLASAWSSNGSSCREKDRYIKSRASYRSRWTEPVPYSWNYSLSPMRIANPSNKSDIKTVKGLSEAVLAYRKEDVIDSDTGKYLELIRKKWEDRTDVEKQQLVLAGRICKVTDWTRDWINVHRTFLRESTKQHISPTRPIDWEVKPRPRPAERKSKRQTFAWGNGYDKYSRVPANTPLSMVPRTVTRSSKRVERLESSPV